MLATIVSRTCYLIQVRPQLDTQQHLPQLLCRTRKTRPKCYTWPGSNWRPSACEADSIATRPQVPLHCALLQSQCDEYAIGCTHVILLWCSGPLKKMDTLGFEPRAFRMRSGCDTTTPCARAKILVQTSILEVCDFSFLIVSGPCRIATSDATHTLACGSFWPSGLRRWLQAPVRKGVGSNPTAVICPFLSWRMPTGKL